MQVPTVLSIFFPPRLSGFGNGFVQVGFFQLWGFFSSSWGSANCGIYFPPLGFPALLSAPPDTSPTQSGLLFFMFIRVVYYFSCL